jgi:hypothetical protein
MAELQGQVDGEAGEPVTAILVDAEKGGDGVTIVKKAEADQKGRFHMETVPPGSYRLFAIEDFDEDDWGSPELVKLLQAKSVELEMKENEKKQATVTLLPAAEWNAAVKKAGGEL